MEINPEINFSIVDFTGNPNVTFAIIRIGVDGFLYLSENAVVFYYADYFRTLL